MASDLYDLKDSRLVSSGLESLSYNLRQARLVMAAFKKADLGSFVSSEPEFQATIRLMDIIDADAGPNIGSQQTLSNLPLPNAFLEMRDLKFPKSVAEVVPPVGPSTGCGPCDDNDSTPSYPATRRPSIDIGTIPPQRLSMHVSSESTQSTTPPSVFRCPYPPGGCTVPNFGRLANSPMTGGVDADGVERQHLPLWRRMKALERGVDVLEQKVDDLTSLVVPRASERPSSSKPPIVVDPVGATLNSAMVAASRSDLEPSLSRVPVTGFPGTPLPQLHTPTIHKASSATTGSSSFQDTDFDPLSGIDFDPTCAAAGHNDWGTTPPLDYLAQLDPLFGAQLDNSPAPATPSDRPLSSSSERDRVEDWLMCDFLPLNQAESSLKVPDASRAETPIPSPSSNAALNKTGAGTRKVYFHNLTPHVAFPPLKLPDLPNDVLLQRLPGDNAGAVLIIPRTMEIDILKPLLSLIRTLIEREGHGLIRPVIRPGGHPMSMLRLQGVYFVRNGTQTGMAGQRAASSLNDVRREVELKHPIVGAALVPVAEGGKTVMLSGYAGSGGGGGGGGGGKRRNSALAGSGIGNANGALTVCDVALQVRESRVVQVQAYLTRMADPTKILLFGRDTVVEMLQLVD